MNEPWTLQKALNWTIAHFTDKHIPEARLSAELLLAKALGCRRIELYLHFERILTPAERAAYREMIHRRLSREPLQYILGECEFMGLGFTVTPAVLIPRPETELLVDALLARLREAGRERPRILDIGTGSGCIAVALARHLPEAQVWAVEKSAAAREVAAANIERHREKVALLGGDVFAADTDLGGPYDVLVANPPYVARAAWETLEPEVRDHEPAEALLGGEDGLDFYRRLLPLSQTLLAENGMIFLETGYDQAGTVAEAFRKAGYRCEIRKDYQQIERIVIAQREEN